MTSQIIAAVGTAAGTVAAGWFAWLAKRAQHRSPETVAGGYSLLVDDMRRELERVAACVQQLEQEKAHQRDRIQCLERKVSWLTDRISDDDRAAYDEAFPRRRHDHG